MVTSKKFDSIPDNWIVDDVERDNLTIKTLFPQDKKKNKEVGKIQEWLVKLCGMKQCIERNSREVMGVFILERDTPGDRTFRSVTTPSTEAAQTAKAVAKSKSRTDDVCSFPCRNFISSEKPECKEKPKS